MLILLAGMTAVGVGAANAQSPSPAAGDARYALAGGCYVLRSQALGRLVAKAGDGGYRAASSDPAGAEPFRMQATDLGSYLLYGPAAEFLAGVPAGGERIVARRSIDSALKASERADWRLDAVGAGAFRLTLLEAGGGALAVAPEDDELVLADADEAGVRALFSFESAKGCASFPEVEVGAIGEPSKGRTPYGEVSGFLEGHMHMMAFEFLGGRAHCGRPWHRYGVAHALVDCPDHEPMGAPAVLENVLYGNPARTHDTIGWPTFRDWPHHRSLTHEQSYYRWVERAWRGGLRVFVNLLVDNAALCEVYPYKRNSCNEMDGVRLQARRIRELEDYIDAQHGGPGKGWFRIVTDPFQARQVANQGKLAVVLGIEVSELFDCGLDNERPRCGRAQIDRQLEEVQRLGVRDMELVNKFDNALAGVAFDAGPTGVVVNAGNRYRTGKFWQMERCTGHVHDNPQIALPGVERDSLVGNGLGALLPAGTAPVYTEPPHCNTRGLSALGEYLVRRMIDRGMIVDPDHLSVLARSQVLSILEAEDYSGVISSHSWADAESYPRIYRLGGVVTPYAGSSTGFVKAWREIKPLRDRRVDFGFGYGADANGFGAQGGPRPDSGENPVRYPFRSFDGAVTIERQRSGERVFDINVDGVAHYGLYPDWIEDLRMIAGDGIVRDMARGAEAYLQMWERAVGVGAERCRSPRERFSAGGLAGVRLGDRVEGLLRRAGQPEERSGRSWEYCVRGEGNRRAEVSTVLTPGGKVVLVASTASGHTAAGIGSGDSAGRLRGARPLAGGVFVRPAGGGSRFVYGARKGRVRWVAVARRSLGSSPTRLRAHLRLAGLR